MNPWPTFQELVEQEVRRLEPILRDRKIIPQQEERSADSNVDAVEPA